MRWAAKAALAAAVIAIAVVLLNGGGASYVVRAEFADAGGLQAGFSVRDQGVVVGSVASVTVTRRDTALVTLHLQSAVAPIGAGATASIHPSNLLGEKYVQLDAGNVRRPQPSGTGIPLSRTSTAPELDQVLDAFNPDTRQATAIFLAEQGNALLGRGADLARVLARLPSSLQSGRQLVSGLGQDNQALGRLIDESDGILAAAAPRRAALGRLVSSADGAFTTLASREQDLGDTISRAPSALAQLRGTLVALQQSAGPLGAAARGLRATAPALAQTLTAVPGFARAAVPTLNTATAAAPALERLGAEGTPLVGLIRPAASRLAALSLALAPVSRLLDRNINTILDVFQGWARAIADRDGVGHMYRIETVLPSTTFASVLDALGGIARPNPTTARPARTEPRTARSTPGPRGPGPHPTGRRTRRGRSHATARAPARAATNATTPTPTTTATTPSATSPVSSLLSYLLK